MRPVIVDTHTHVVSHDRERYPVRPPEGLARMTWFDDHPVDVHDLLREMDGAGVHGAVLVQAKGAYGFDNSYAADARAAAPARLANASIVDMQAPDRLAQLEYWAIDRGMLGTRLFNIPSAKPSWLDDPATGDVVQAANRLGVRIAVCVLVDDLPLVGALCDLARDVPIALDHCGFADLREQAAELFALARHKNLRLKVTTTLLEPVLTSGGDPRDALERLCDAFGVERLMWGSDYPQHHSEPYAEIVGLARHACSRLSPAEQERFLGGTALELFPELTPPD
ncbi:MAG TPA: amidohydrolase family protein [Acidimicrobiales bacterium]